MSAATLDPFAAVLGSRRGTGAPPRTAAESIHQALAGQMLLFRDGDWMDRQRTRVRLEQRWADTFGLASACSGLDDREHDRLMCLLDDLAGKLMKLGYLAPTYAAAMDEEATATREGRAPDYFAVTDAEAPFSSVLGAG